MLSAEAGAGIATLPQACVRMHHIDKQAALKALSVVRGSFCLHSKLALASRALGNLILISLGLQPLYSRLDGSLIPS